MLIRSAEEIKSLVAEDPFKAIDVKPQTRLYVTFLTEPPIAEPDLKSLNGPQFQIINASATEVCSVLTLSENGQTTELMAGLEKALGKNITTRNWNTVLKIAERLS